MKEPSSSCDEALSPAQHDAEAAAAKVAELQRSADELRATQAREARERLRLEQALSPERGPGDRTPQ